MEPHDRVEALAREFSHHDEGLDAAFDVYRELRDRCPVGFSERFGGFRFVTRFDDIHRVEQDPETFAVSPGMLLPPMGHVRPGIPIDIDPPMHAKYRKLMLPAFSVRRRRTFRLSSMSILRQVRRQYAPRGLALPKCVAVRRFDQRMDDIRKPFSRR